MSDQIEQFIAEGYKRFPDDVEPVDYHPAGKITVDRGNLRYAFLEGALFAAIQAKSEWRSIESAPKDKRVLLLTGGGEVAAGKWLDNSMTKFPWVGWSTDLGPIVRTTHWMPLPSPRHQNRAGIWGQ